MKHIFLVIFLFATTLANSQSPCTNVTLEMEDSYGDGWNGATWTATGLNTGNTYGPYTLNNGSSGNMVFCMVDDCYEIIVTSGSWPGEVSWELETTSGNVIISAGAPFNNSNFPFSTGDAQCDCTSGNGNQTFTLNPTGPYSPGDVVTVSYTLNNFLQINVNWIIAFEIGLGNGWTNLTSITTPLNPNPYTWQGFGNWIWDVQNTFPSGYNFGPGWRFINTGGVNNNWGSASTGPFTMSFQVTVGQFCTAEDLSIDMSAIGDCQTGGWFSSSCCPITPFEIYSGTIDVPPSILLSSVVNDVSCNGGSTGSIDLSVTGGSSPYTYSWSNSSVSQDLTQLSAGIYNVTVLDDLGCSSTLSNILVDEPVAISVTASSDQLKCEGIIPDPLSANPSSNGSNFTWTPATDFVNANVQNPIFISGLLSTTTYTVTFIDNNGCIATDDVTISIIPPFTTQPISHN